MYTQPWPVQFYLWMAGGWALIAILFALWQ